MPIRSSILIAALTLFSALEAHCYRVLIDPGHGGRDFGARVESSSQSVTEADIAWVWSLELKRALKERGIEAQLSRNEKEGMSISRRLAQAKASQFDLVMSLHANSILDSRVKGIEYYIAAPQSLEDQALKLAHEETLIRSGAKKSITLNVDVSLEKKSQVSTILNDLQTQAKLERSLYVAQLLNQTWPGKIKQGPFDLLSSSEIPAVLIEIGFLSNPQDLSQLTDPQFRQLKSSEIAETLSRFFKGQNSTQY